MRTRGTPATMPQWSPSVEFVERRRGTGLEDALPFGGTAKGARDREQTTEADLTSPLEDAIGGHRHSRTLGELLLSPAARESLVADASRDEQCQLNRSSEDNSHYVTP